VVERARLEIVYVPRGASRVRIPLSPPNVRSPAVRAGKSYRGRENNQVARLALKNPTHAMFDIKIGEEDKESVFNLSGPKGSSRGISIFVSTYCDNSLLSQ
jgi:hypothetical protein